MEREQSAYWEKRDRGSILYLYTLDSLDSPELNEALAIYTASFSRVELKPVVKITSLLQRDKNYHIIVAKSNGFVVGMALLYVFKSLGVGLLDYMAIKPQYQRQGIGTKLFQYTFDVFEQETDNPTGLLLEIQKEGADNIFESQIRRDRIRFYAKLGAKNLAGVTYLLPPQYGTEPEEMYLMIVPFGNIEALPKTLVLRYIKAIYTKLYEYKNKDLLNTISKTMPKTIQLIPISMQK